MNHPEYQTALALVNEIRRLDRENEALRTIARESHEALDQARRLYRIEAPHHHDPTPGELISWLVRRAGL